MTTISGNNTGGNQLTTVRNTISGTSNQVQPDKWVIGESAYTFIRPRAVTFKVEGLKPNTRYYAFFNDVYVGAYCSTVDGQQTSNLVTNSHGAMMGNFYIPAGTFVSGTHVFKLVDNVKEVTSGSTTVTIADPIYGSAESLYEANGVLKGLQTQVTQPDGIVLNPIGPVTGGSGSTTTVNQPPVITCERWYFEYTISNETTHMGRSTNGVFRQEWEGPTVTNPVTDLPSLNNFRPSGVSSRARVSIKKQWTRVGPVACPIQYGLKTVKRIDPLAQSFFVDAEKYPQGIFVTSISVYFRTVDQSTPVIIELRDMSNGLPGSNILPGGTAVIPGFATSQSDDASVPTTFRFDHPIFLQPSTDYCFVLKSTSLGYNVWCSRMGEIDVLSNRVIEEQPHLGTLFKSENDVTWIPDSYEDIKFDLNVAAFDTSVTSSLVFRPQTSTGNVFVTPTTGTIVDIDDDYVSSAQTLPLSYISTTRGSKRVKIRVPMHNLQEQDYVRIGGIQEATINGIPTANMIGVFDVKAVVDEDTIAIDLNGSEVATYTGALRVKDSFSVTDRSLALVPMGITYDVADPVVNSDNLSPSTIQTATYEFVQPQPFVVLSDASFSIYCNVQVNEVMIDYMGTEVGQTEIVEKIVLTRGKSTEGDETPYDLPETIIVDNDGAFYSLSNPKMLATTLNEFKNRTTLGAGNQSCVVELELSSQHKDLSPIIDTTGMSLMVRSYKINNQNGEIDDLITAAGDANDFNNPILNSEISPGTGKATAKYKSPINNLETPAKGIMLFVTANCPAPAKIDAYIRSSTDEETHVDREWAWVPIDGVHGSTFVNSPDKFVMNEWMFVYEPEENFTVFDVKLVMRSTNNSVIPKIYGVRTMTNPA